jgi:nitrite reductase (NADH) small subunit
MTSSKLRKVAKLADLPPGNAMTVAVGDLRIALYNVAGKIYASDDACVHAGGPLGDGPLRDSIITCPWHGWEFDVVKGCAVMSDDVRLTTYDVQVKGKDIFVSIEPRAKA